jgi:hypothetical protein
MQPERRSWLDGASARDARLNRRMLRVMAAIVAVTTFGTYWITGAPISWAVNTAAFFWGGIWAVLASLPGLRSDTDRQRYRHPAARRAYDFGFRALLPLGLLLICLGARSCYLFMNSTTNR